MMDRQLGQRNSKLTRPVGWYWCSQAGAQPKVTAGEPVTWQLMHHKDRISRRATFQRKTTNQPTVDELLPPSSREIWGICTLPYDSSLQKYSYALNVSILCHVTTTKHECISLEFSVKDKHMVV